VDGRNCPCAFGGSNFSYFQLRGWTKLPLCFRWIQLHGTEKARSSLVFNLSLGTNRGAPAEDDQAAGVLRGPPPLLCLPLLRLPLLRPPLVLCAQLVPPAAPEPRVRSILSNSLAVTAQIEKGESALIEIELIPGWMNSFYVRYVNYFTNG
jgi:hypothetical protein